MPLSESGTAQHDQSIRVWDTKEVLPANAFEYYREGICDAFMELTPEAEEVRRASFSARVENIPAGAGAINKVRASSHLVRRAQAEIARSTQECYYLNLTTGGSCIASQAGKERTAKAGDLYIFDSALPFDLEHRKHPSLAVTSFWVPKAALHERLGAGCQPSLSIVSDDPQSGKLACEVARTLSQGAAAMPDEMRERLFNVLIDLTAMSFMQPKDWHPVSRRMARHAELCNLIDRHANDPRFGPEKAARLAGMSVRYLHNLFAEGEGSFGDRLKQKRISNAAAMLRNPGLSSIPITTIAYDCGFADPAHFARVFREERGCSPSDWRLAGSRFATGKNTGRH